MSIASEITRIGVNIQNAYSACDSKGATMPVTQNSANLATCIGSISQNSGINREVVNGVYSVPTTSFTFTLPSGVVDVGGYALFYALYYSSGLTSVDLSGLTTISGNSAMDHAFSYSNLVSLNLSNLTTISGYHAMNAAFQGCTYLTSVNLSNLATITGHSAMQYTFQGCTSLTSISFPSLTSASFGSYTNQFDNMLYGVTGCTVHFPTSLQSVIGNWASVQNGFGGTNTAVLFDIGGETTRTITLSSSGLGGNMDSDSADVADSIFNSGSMCMWGEQGGSATDYTFTTPSNGTTLTCQIVTTDANEGMYTVPDSFQVVVNNNVVLSYPSTVEDITEYVDLSTLPVGTVNLAGNTQVTLRFLEPTGFGDGIVYNIQWTEVESS